jgi:hypothetical protein
MNRTRRTLTAFASVVALTAPFALGSAAAGAAASSTTGHDHGGVNTFYDTRPCGDDGVGYEIVSTTNSVEHETENANGGHFTFTETGSFTAAPVEVLRDGEGTPIRGGEDEELTPALDGDGNVVYLAGPTYAGHYTAWGGGNSTRGGTAFTFTFSVNGIGSDGSTFGQNSVFHAVSSPGDPDDPNLLKVIFEHEVCR